MAGTHDDAVVFGKRHLILWTNDHNHARCVASVLDVFVLLNIERHRQAYTQHPTPQTSYKQIIRSSSLFDVC